LKTLEDGDLKDLVLEAPETELDLQKPLKLLSNCRAWGDNRGFAFALYFLPLSELRNPTAKTPGSGELLIIRWTITKKPNSEVGLDVGENRMGQSWQSVTHFSTLRNGGIPEDGVDFFKRFLDNLQEKWLKMCQDADHVLADRVCDFKHFLSDFFPPPRSFTCFSSQTFPLEYVM
jgi:hypothetical protein